MGIFERARIQRFLRRSEAGRPDVNECCVRLFTINTVLSIDHKPGLTFKDVCEHAAREVGILPINLPFFSLVKIESGHVVNLQETVQENDCNKNYQFSFVFKACHASWFVDKSSLDENAFNYLFHQCQHDFLQHSSKIKFLQRKHDNVWFVKAVLCELVFLAKENGVKSSFVLDHAKHYKVSHILKRGLFANKNSREVKSYLRQHLPKFENLELQKVKKEFLHCIENSYGFFVHIFHMNKVSRSDERAMPISVHSKLFISPRFGIKMKQEHKAFSKVIIKNFNEVSKLKITQKEEGVLVTIYISRTDPISQVIQRNSEVLYAQSLADAQSIVAIIEGYYKLLVNRYKVLLADRYRQQGHPFQVKIHGPITRPRAVSKTQEYSSSYIKDGLYLIRRSRDKYNWYHLTLFHNKSWVHYNVLEENGEFFLENASIKFKDWNDFTKHYEKNKDGLVCCLRENCPPKEEGLDALLDVNVCKEIPADRPQNIGQFGVKTIDIKDLRPLPEIGQDEYGKVFKAQWMRNSKESPLDVAIRKLKKATYDEGFFDIARKLTNLKNLSIQRCYGVVRMRDGLGLVFEFAPQSIDTFLCEKVQSNVAVTVETVLQYAVQVTEGMIYLSQKKKFIHGRLCAQNILVQCDGHNIKISDVGLTQLKKNGGQFFAGKVWGNRHCWHAPELLLFPSNNPTYETDIWSYGWTIWELFTLKKPFHRADGSWLRREQVLHCLSTRRNSLSRDSIPIGIAGVIQKCWNREPKERMGFKEVLLELRDVLIQNDHQKDLKHLLAQDTNNIEFWEIDLVQPPLFQPQQVTTPKEKEKCEGCEPQRVTTPQEKKKCGGCEPQQVTAPHEQEKSGGCQLQQVIAPHEQEKCGGCELQQVTAPHKQEKRGGCQLQKATIHHEQENCGGCELQQVTAPHKQEKSGGCQLQQVTAPHEQEKHGGYEPEQVTTPHEQEKCGGCELQGVTIPHEQEESGERWPKQTARGYQRRGVNNIKLQPIPEIELDDHGINNVSNMSEDISDIDWSSGSVTASSFMSINELDMPKPAKMSRHEFKAHFKKEHIIDESNLTTGKYIGKGNFGCVREGTLLNYKRMLGSRVNQDKDVAIKELIEENEKGLKEKNAAEKAKSREDFINEAIIYSKLMEINNKNIIKLIGVCILGDEKDEHEYTIQIVTELAPFGNLQCYLQKVKKEKGAINISILLDFCVQICNGMEELEEEGILHRDLALRNILLVSNNLVKISDFGLSRLNDIYECKDSRRWPLKWYAPESQEYGLFTSKSDIWSFGVLMWEIFSYGATPYPNIKSHKIFDHISHDNRLPQPHECPDDIYHIMKQCWCFDQKTRPSFYQLSSTLLPAVKIKYC